jgi:hypothetical protein
MSLRYLTEDRSKPNLNIRCQSATFDADKAITFNGNVPVDNSIIDCLGIAADGTLSQKKFSQLDTYDCIIPDNSSTIAEAIADGCRNIYIRNGIYNETETSTTTDTISITGESDTNVHINYSAVAGNGMEFGDIPFIGTGSLSISHDSKTINGSGTNFLSIPNGYVLQFLGNTFQIESIESDTSLTLSAFYRGNIGPFVSYIALPPISVNLSNLRVTSAGSRGITVNGCSVLNINNILTDNNTSYGLYANNFSVGYLSNIYSKSNNSTGIYIKAIYSFLSMENVSSNNNDGRGILHDQSGIITTQGSTHIISNCNCVANASYGFHVLSSTGTIIVSNCSGIFNNDHGFYVDGPRVQIKLNNCKSRGNNGNGFRSNNNQLTGDILFSNCSTAGNVRVPLMVAVGHCTFTGGTLRGLTLDAINVLNNISSLTITDNKTDCVNLINENDKFITNSIISNNVLLIGDVAAGNINIKGESNVITSNRNNNITINGNNNTVTANVVLELISISGGNKCSVTANNCITMFIAGNNHAVIGNTLRVPSPIINTSTGTVGIAMNNVA